VNWRASAEARLPDHLDENGDLAPPWEKFPEYERYTLGWRMGTGEAWMCMWSVFLDKLGTEPAVRLAYLQRHAPAPWTWANLVHSVLAPAADDDDDDDGDVRAERIQQLQARGLIASDIAWSTWCRRNPSHAPWEHAKTPVDGVQYHTRELWFWSRRVSQLRQRPGWAPPAVPAEWEPCAAPLRDASAGDVDAGQGLLTLARMLAAGRVVPPWELGLGPEAFADSFEDDMGYVDAYRLWGMSVFDDRPQLESFVPADSVPVVWRAWMGEHFHVE
jgi:hypothetical protein